MEYSLKSIRKHVTLKNIGVPSLATLNKWHSLFSGFKANTKTLTDDEIIILSNSITRYIEAVVDYAIDCGTQDITEDIRKLLQVVSKIAGIEGIQNEYILNIAPRVIEIVTDPSVTWCGKELLKAFNVCLINSNKKIRQEIISQDNLFHLYKLVDLLGTCGDYEYQETILESIFRMCSENQIRTYTTALFPEAKNLQQSFLQITRHTFDTDIRKFLNLINMKTKKVFAIVSNIIQFDREVVPPLKDFDDINGLWVDFNLEPKTVSFYCYKYCVKMVSKTEDKNELWQLVTLHSRIISSIRMKINENKLHIHFHLAEHAHTKLSKLKKITFIIEDSDRTRMLHNYILPKMFEDKILGTDSSQKSSDEYDLHQFVGCSKKTHFSYKPLQVHVSANPKKSIVSSNSSLKALSDMLKNNAMEDKNPFPYCGVFSAPNNETNIIREVVEEEKEADVEKSATAKIEHVSQKADTDDEWHSIDEHDTITKNDEVAKEAMPKQSFQKVTVSESCEFFSADSKSQEVALREPSKELEKVSKNVETEFEKINSQEIKKEKISQATDDTELLHIDLQSTESDKSVIETNATEDAQKEASGTEGATTDVKKNNSEPELESLVFLMNSENFPETSAITSTRPSEKTEKQNADKDATEFLTSIEEDIEKVKSLIACTETITFEDPKVKEKVSQPTNTPESKQKVIEEVQLESEQLSTEKSLKIQSPERKKLDLEPDVVERNMIQKHDAEAPKSGMKMNKKGTVTKDKKNKMNPKDGKQAKKKTIKATKKKNLDNVENTEDEIHEVIQVESDIIESIACLIEQKQAIQSREVTQKDVIEVKCQNEDKHEEEESELSKDAIEKLRLEHATDYGLQHLSPLTVETAAVNGDEKIEILTEEVEKDVKQGQDVIAAAGSKKKDIAKKKKIDKTPKNKTKMWKIKLKNVSSDGEHLEVEDAILNTDEDQLHKIIEIQQKDVSSTISAEVQLKLTQDTKETEALNDLKVAKKKSKVTNRKQKKSGKNLHEEAIHTECDAALNNKEEITNKETDIVKIPEAVEKIVDTETQLLETNAESNIPLAANVPDVENDGIENCLPNDDAINKEGLNAEVKLLDKHKAIDNKTEENATIQRRKISDKILQTDDDSESDFGGTVGIEVDVLVHNECTERPINDVIDMVPSPALNECFTQTVREKVKRFKTKRSNKASAKINDIFTIDDTNDKLNDIVPLKCTDENTDKQMKDTEVNKMGLKEALVTESNNNCEVDLPNITLKTNTTSSTWKRKRKLYNPDDVTYIDTNVIETTSITTNNTKRAEKLMLTRPLNVIQEEIITSSNRSNKAKKLKREKQHTPKKIVVRKKHRKEHRHFTHAETVIVPYLNAEDIFANWENFIKENRKKQRAETRDKHEKKNTSKKRNVNKSSRKKSTSKRETRKRRSSSRYVALDNSSMAEAVEETYTVKTKKRKSNSISEKSKQKDNVEITKDKNANKKIKILSNVLLREKCCS